MIKNWIAKVFGFQNEISELRIELHNCHVKNQSLLAIRDNLTGQLNNAIREHHTLSALYEALEMKYDKKDKAYKELSRKFRALKPRFVKKYGGEK